MSGPEAEVAPRLPCDTGGTVEPLQLRGPDRPMRFLDRTTRARGGESARHDTRTDPLANLRLLSWRRRTRHVVAHDERHQFSPRGPAETECLNRGNNHPLHRRNEPKSGLFLQLFYLILRQKSCVRKTNGSMGRQGSHTINATQTESRVAAFNLHTWMAGNTRYCNDLWRCTALHPFT